MEEIKTIWKKGYVAYVLSVKKCISTHLIYIWI